MPQNNINVTALQQFINQVKAADLGSQKEVRIPIVAAKTLSYTIALVLARLAGDYEGLISEVQKDGPAITISMDGGQWGK